MKLETLKIEFVEFIPDSLQYGILYISIPYTTVLHKCACGCGMEVVTPLSPSDWRFIFDGVSISIEPSIGNWSFRCRSHYWIVNNKILWAKTWSVEKVMENREYDKLKKQSFYERITSCKSDTLLQADKKSLTILEKFRIFLKNF